MREIDAARNQDENAAVAALHDARQASSTVLQNLAAGAALVMGVMGLCLVWLAGAPVAIGAPEWGPSTERARAIDRLIAATPTPRFDPTPAMLQ